MRSDFIGRGWAFPFDVNNNGGMAMVGGAAKLEQAMTLVLSTQPGERPFRPEFGCPLRNYVFAEQSDDVLADIARDVRTSIERWEPRVVVADVVVAPHPDDTRLLLIDIAYSTKTENDPRNLTFPFYTIPDEGSD
jgi:phage baseplate assembly protein W